MVVHKVQNSNFEDTIETREQGKTIENLKPLVKQPIERCPDEIRVQQTRSIRDLVEIASEKFRKDGLKSIRVRASGRAIPNAIAVCEIVKRRIPNLHQQTDISLQSIPHELIQKTGDSLDDVTTKIINRSVACIEITLSTFALDKENPGYQQPIDQSFVKEAVLDAVQSNNLNKKVSSRYARRRYSKNIVDRIEQSIV
ncbi:hypothetical protein cand_005850 [Cryptosporidium andersoni]|uniref:DNA/RNA-binding protein Alba-like domain-containing protein n=1 Tax=Cryptosporidium andersoni TaxID=117008 RepID=A0A1J4MRW5_9CRYT|nr:hypothetical protein cand_005850 [Cryptosporidium andersoni]